MSNLITRPSDWDYSQPWYHGSQQKLTVLRTGSSISQNRMIARFFSHRPQIVSQYDDGSIKHDGTTSGFLFIIDEEISAEDVYPHPHPVNASYWEWLTTRELKIRLIEETVVHEEEFLTDKEIADLKRKQAKAGQATFRADTSG